MLFSMCACLPLLERLCRSPERLSRRHTKAFHEIPDNSTMRNMHLGAHSSSATPELCICSGKDEVTEIFGVKDCLDVQDIPADTQFNVEPSLKRRSQSHALFHHRTNDSSYAPTCDVLQEHCQFGDDISEEF